MKAWVLHDIGKLQFEDVGMPALLDDEVLVEVRAAGICGSDISRVYESGAHRMPLIIGHEFSGKVIKTGKKVNQSWNGKRVSVFPLIPCRTCRSCYRMKYEMCSQYSYLGSRTNGGFAQYVAVPEWNLIELPPNVSYEAAAMAEPMAVAVHAVRRVRPVCSDYVAVYGLGTIGQLLTMFLFEEGFQNLLVIGNKDLQKQDILKIGISECNYCDSRTQNVDDWILERTEGRGADVLFECVGKNETIAQSIHLTAQEGKICLVGNPGADVYLKKHNYWKILRNQLTLIGTWNSSYGGKKEDDWKFVLKKLEDDKIKPSKLISHRYAMEELEKGLLIMKNKTEDYIKIMVKVNTEE